MAVEPRAWICGRRAPGRRRANQPSERPWHGRAGRPAGAAVEHRAHGRGGIHAGRYLASRAVTFDAGQASGDRRERFLRDLARRPGSRVVAMDERALEHCLVRGRAGRKRRRAEPRPAPRPAGWPAERVVAGCRLSPPDAVGGTGADRTCCTSSRQADGCPARSTTSASPAKRATIGARSTIAWCLPAASGWARWTRWERKRRFRF